VSGPPSSGCCPPPPPSIPAFAVACTYLHRCASTALTRGRTPLTLVMSYVPFVRTPGTWRTGWGQAPTGPLRCTLSAWRCAPASGAGARGGPCCSTSSSTPGGGAATACACTCGCPTSWPSRCTCLPHRSPCLRLQLDRLSEAAHSRRCFLPPFPCLIESLDVF
jgi:hypothetical protein